MMIEKEKCYGCASCGGECDGCDLICCLDNIERHNELLRLKDVFINRVYYAKNDIEDICNEIKLNLNLNYGINIEISTTFDKLYQSQDFLNNLENKKQELINDLENINQERDNAKKLKENEIMNLNSIHQRKIDEANQKYKDKMKNYEINELKFEKEISEKKLTIQDLNKQKKEINIDIDGIVKSFVEDEKLKAEKEFDSNIQQINNNYLIKEEELKQPTYNKDELRIKNECLDEIQKLNAYSDKIPNFKNWINLYGLNKYIK